MSLGIKIITLQIYMCLYANKKGSVLIDYKKLREQ